MSLGQEFGDGPEWVPALPAVGRDDADARNANQGHRHAETSAEEAGAAKAVGAAAGVAGAG